VEILEARGGIEPPNKGFADLAREVYNPVYYQEVSDLQTSARPLFVPSVTHFCLSKLLTFNTRKSAAPATIAGQFGVISTAPALRLSTWWEAVCPIRIIV
jgi:hypothetical protein